MHWGNLIFILPGQLNPIAIHSHFHFDNIRIQSCDHSLQAIIMVDCDCTLPSFGRATPENRVSHVHTFTSKCKHVAIKRLKHC